jgi:hypothetical protein
MGCFNYTCCVSGLPIMGGHKVRYFLLTENKLSDRIRPIHIHDVWVPRTFPLKAEYNDYGTVEEIESGPAQDIWMEAFAKDIRPLGPGDNQCHDVPVTPNMSFEDLLEAVWECRVSVLPVHRLKLNAESVAEFRSKLPAGLPTLERVRVQLKPIAKGYGQKGYVVDELENGIVRVRWGAFSAKPNLRPFQRAEKLLNRNFVTVITVGSGSYSHGGAELRVFAKPGTDLSYWGADKDTLSDTAPRQIAQAMIREDVWQALLRERLTNDWSDKPAPTLDEFKREVRKEYTDLRAKFVRDAARKKVRNPTPAQVRKQLEEMHRELESMSELPHPAVAYLRRGDAPAGTGLSHHWKLFTQKGLSLKQATRFLDSVAEMAYVTRVLMGVRHVWRPSSSAGSQVGEFDKHLSFHNAMAQICKDRLREMSEDE